MKKIQHLVLTRFNLRLSSRSERWGVDKSGNPIDHDQWLQHRFDLFERYCLPSMAAQKNPDFQWLLFFDSATAARDRERIEKARTICPQIKIFYIDGTDTKEAVSKAIEPDTGVLITTRLDNDDAFHEQALSVIRDMAQKTRENICINLRYGFAFNGSDVEIVSHKFNPFSSLVELREQGPFNTVFGVKHGKIARLAKVKQIYTAPYWLSVIHDRNIANRSPSEFRHFKLFDWRGFRRYLKRYLLPKLRRFFWPPQVRREYSLKEIQEMFHIKTQ
ncbi:MAG: hypothetical protein GWP56_05545 [Gammaproteobacteria bacterium]|jgi:hypothetical protein|nr:hypothetical protein [Gammaproteobacteria bacterium]